ncbi:hypothetical protein K2173_018007 [Erythroxylum novogranatense]|uniref:F-box domain-containing protein n=1 Tax=Erythroxylum novogranatense TaxID=1862640 RepID=A0AAV8TU79_9ROSI|nr:hypothetical protein K2173_018007 [Erythroxylum novogranatense]
MVASSHLSNISTCPEISATLPSDILTDIFSRLPVKSIARFKCVSKSMSLLLKNPVFVKQHLQRAISEDPNLILKVDHKLFSVEDEDWSKCRKLHIPFTSSMERVELSGSCNGLLCISDQLCDEDIFLYNPSIGVSRKLPSPYFDVPATEGSCFTTIGFGFHQAENDYKIVRCVYLYDKPFLDIESYRCEARVYSLSTNKWKKIGVIPFHLGYRTAIWLGNEYFVWKASRVTGQRVTSLVVSFDMNREEFKEIPQPDTNYPEDTHVEVGSLGAGYLSMFYLRSNDGVDIWSMKDYCVKESWNLLFVIRRPEIVNHRYMFLRPLAILKNGEIVIEAGERASVVQGTHAAWIHVHGKISNVSQRSLLGVADYL